MLTIRWGYEILIAGLERLEVFCYAFLGFKSILVTAVSSLAGSGWSSRFPPIPSQLTTHLTIFTFLPPFSGLEHPLRLSPPVEGEAVF
jgi:hypothetical protein